MADTDTTQGPIAAGTPFPAEGREMVARVYEGHAEPHECCAPGDRLEAERRIVCSGGRHGLTPTPHKAPSPPARRSRSANTPSNLVATSSSWWTRPRCATTRPRCARAWRPTVTCSCAAFIPAPTHWPLARWTLDAIAREGGLKEGSDVADGLIGAENRNFPFFRQVEVSHGPPILNVVNSRATFAFFEALFGKPVLTFDKRWLRCMAKGRHNHFHYDNVYVGRGTPNRVTMWTALSGADLGGGPLVIGLGSNRHRRLIETYGATDMDRDLTDAVFTQDPRELVEDFGFKLATTRYQPGDAIIFGMFMLHSSAPNLSDRYRISIDTRYQPKDEATDERFFFGEDGTWLGNFSNKGATYKPMSELREEWGI